LSLLTPAVQVVALHPGATAGAGRPWQAPRLLAAWHEL
jgi:hypothetical protein